MTVRSSHPAATDPDIEHGLPVQPVGKTLSNGSFRSPSIPVAGEVTDDSIVCERLPVAFSTGDRTGQFADGALTSHPPSLLGVS